MGKTSSGSEYERLKEELRRMKRQGAPWYFESELHQRLHGGTRRRRRLRPISTGPVLFIAFITLDILGLALYVVLVRSNLFPQGAAPLAPADTVSRTVNPDTVGTRAPGKAPRAREAPRLPRTAEAVTDTLPAHPRRGALLDADSARRAHPLPGSGSDTVIRGVDTTRPPP